MTGIRVTTGSVAVLTDPNSPPADSATFKWGSESGDRSNVFSVTPPANTALGAMGITAPGQYFMAATLTAGGVESDESNEVPFELAPMAPTLDVQP